MEILRYAAVPKKHYRQDRAVRSEQPGSGPGSLGRTRAEKNMSKIYTIVHEILNDIIKKSNDDEIGNYIMYLHQPNLSVSQKNLCSSGLLCQSGLLLHELLAGEGEAVLTISMALMVTVNLFLVAVYLARLVCGMSLSLKWLTTVLHL